MRKTILVALTFALLQACHGGSNLPATPNNFTPQGAKRDASGTDTRFSVQGRYIEERIIDGAPVKMFVKGMVYSPTPIGRGVSDPPLLDDSLRDGNMPIWSRDLPLMRAMGVNAIHVYNVVPPPYDKHTGPIFKFLDAAWNNGKDPVYVIMSIYFQGKALEDRGATDDLARQYFDLDKTYAGYPAVMGVTISNEIVAENFRNKPARWQNFNVVAQKAKDGFTAGGDSSKLVMTSEADGNLGAIEFGEKFKAKVDVWGVNIYRGRTFTNMFEQIMQFTKKPVLLTEYGATAAYHPAWQNTYVWDRGPHGFGQCVPTTREGPLTRDVDELPDKGNPKMEGLIDLVTNNADWLWKGYSERGGVVSGGFYFEWTDEWWKADNGADPKFRSKHVGSLVFNGHFPGCGEDAAWYGINSISRGEPDLDVLTPRPTLDALKDTWASQK